jgi:O-antigen/teichoic acid export membrane protein
VASADEGGTPRGVLRDAAITVAARLVLAVLILGTDIALARLLGPAAKGRFALVLLYSQLIALVLGWGMDQALAVTSGRDLGAARRGFANAVIWTGVVGGFGMLASAWAYGIGQPGPPTGILPSLLPNLSERQFLYAAAAVPGEMFFSIGLFGLLGRRMIAAYSAVRILRRAILMLLVVSAAAIARLSLDVGLALNLVALGLTAVLIILVAAGGGSFSLRPSGDLLREQLGFGTRSVPGQFAERLQFRADSFIVNLFAGVRQTGIYSVTSGLAETLWYIPNSLGIVMFSRAVDPQADTGGVAAALTRGTVAVTLVAAVPAFLLGPYVAKALYGSQFADAGVALRFILPGVVAYSVVAILSRYLSGRGRPGTTTLILVSGLATNVIANLLLVPRLGINGAALASSISYILTAALTLSAFVRVSGRGLRETLVLRGSDMRAAGQTLRAARAWLLRGRVSGAGVPVPDDAAADAAADLIVREVEPGDES